MKSARSGLFLFGAGLLVAVMVPAFASCADTEDSRPSNDDAGSPLPQVDAGDAGNAHPEAGCDASDSDCVSEIISCDVVPWCPHPVPVSTSYALTAIWGSGAADVWAVGSGGSVAHYDGTKWAETPTGARETFRAVWGSGANDVWAAAMTNSIFHTTGFASGSAEWKKVTDATKGLPRAVYSLWGTTSGDVRIGTRLIADFSTGDRQNIGQHVLVRGTDGELSWKPELGDGAVLGFFGRTFEDLWVVADNSEDPRNEWEKGLIKHTVPDPDGGGGFVWQKVDSQTPSRLNGIWGSSTADMWAVGESGTIRRMKTGQKRWEMASSPTLEALHAVWGSAANDVWAVGDNGTILHFDGTEWRSSRAAFALGKKPNLYGVWGSGPNDVWIVGDVVLHYTGPKGGAR